LHEDEVEDEDEELLEGFHRRADPGPSREWRRRCGFDQALWELDPTGNVLRKVAAAGEKGSTGTAALRADLVALL
jgi:hypothetical protein